MAKRAKRERANAKKKAAAKAVSAAAEELKANNPSSVINPAASIINSTAFFLARLRVCMQTQTPCKRKLAKPQRFCVCVCKSLSQWSSEDLV